MFCVSWDVLALSRKTHTNHIYIIDNYTLIDRNYQSATFYFICESSEFDLHMVIQSHCPFKHVKCCFYIHHFIYLSFGFNRLVSQTTPLVANWVMSVTQSRYAIFTIFESENICRPDDNKRPYLSKACINHTLQILRQLDKWWYWHEKIEIDDFLLWA